ncbi:MAG: hypothetical protein ACRENG_10710 [bacterium]
MKFFKRQYSLDFDQPLWKNAAELFAMEQILEKIPRSSCWPHPAFRRHVMSAKSRLAVMA